jgi:hypothetical protein
MLLAEERDPEKETQREREGEVSVRRAAVLAEAVSLLPYPSFVPLGSQILGTGNQ